MQTEPEAGESAASLQAAIALHKNGRLDPAEAIYLSLLRENEADAGAWHYLGMLRHQRGDSQEGAEMIQRALELNPGDAGAWNNLGIVYRQSGLLEEATAAYMQALKADPLYPEAFGNLGAVFIELGMLEEARQALVRAIELKPDFVKAYLALGRAYQAAGHWQMAVDCYRQAQVYAPGDAGAYRGMWRALIEAKQLEQAEDILREWLAVDPDNPHARHMLAAQTGESAPERASDDYVRLLFDEFAGCFDFVLTEKLDYRAPQWVANAAREACAGREGTLDIADLGCGTGLCGPLLKPLAKTLIGVDLSRKMLDKARGRGVYDLLVEGELTAFLAQTPGAYDLLVSADTLVYFGDLQAFADAARQALRPGGALAFTVERAGDDQAEAYRLQQHGRYAHRADYLDEALQRAGFRSVAREAVFLRKESGNEVGGWLVRAGIA
jgi:predicted TPR repeat methyltransferase